MRCGPTSLFVILVCTGVAGFVGVVTLVGPMTAEEPAKPVGDDPGVASLASDEAIARLKQGNRRCVEGKSVHEHNLAKWRERFLVKQKPFATVLGCSDSRVPPELLFDQGFGELFVIRVAGNIVDPDVVASIQYAVEHLDNKLIVVLGHQNCGAVTAALLPADETRGEPPELRMLLDRIRPALRSVDRGQEAKQRVAAAVEANARASVRRLRKVPSIAAAIRTKNVKVVGAVYQVDSGKITILSE